VAPARIGPVHRFALCCVFLTFVTSGVVFTEPAPVDLGLMFCVLMLPLIGLVRITPPLLLYFSIWLTAVALKLIAAVNAVEPAKAVAHTAVTFFLVLSSFVVAAFVMKRPLRHARLIMGAYVVAAVIAALAALAGYFNLFPGATELFTRYGRASGTFKDPNVFAPFLVPAVLYLLHLILTRSLGRAMLAGAFAGLLMLGVLLSFSRGSWMVLSVSIGIFAYLSFVTARTNLARIKILGGGIAAVSLGLVVMLAAFQLDGVKAQFESRATLDQTYDNGPEGRFGGQQKAKRIILENPFGIGAQQFAPHFHMEEPHNVYLAMFLNAGWLGGMIFAGLVALTVLGGARHALRPTRSQALFIVAYACFIGHALEGFVIDLDHWRHFHLLMALIWGLMLGDREVVGAAVRAVDPRAMFRRAEMVVGQRAARPLTPALPAPVRYARRPQTPAPRMFARRITTAA
jgi:O-antigen ligase